MDGKFDQLAKNFSPLDVASARYVLGIATGHELKEAAEATLERGIYSETLADLSLEPNPIMSDVGLKFERALNEINKNLPTPEKAAIILAIYDLQNIVSEEMSIEEGVYRLYVDICTKEGRLRSGLQFLENDWPTWLIVAIAEYNDIAAGELGDNEETKERLRFDLNKLARLCSREWLAAIIAENGFIYHRITDNLST